MRESASGEFPSCLEKYTLRQAHLEASICSCPNLEPKIRSLSLICPNLRPIYHQSFRTCIGNNNFTVKCWTLCRNLATTYWFIQTFDESRLSWLRELFPEAGKCFTRFQRKHRIPSVSHFIYRNLALKPASAACRTLRARSTRSFCGQKRLSLAKKKPEANSRTIANPSCTPSSDLARLFL